MRTFSSTKTVPYRA